MIEQMGKPENRIAEVVIGATIEVHRHLGPALLESAYPACLADDIDISAPIRTQAMPTAQF
jgi:hypothetical protein